MEWQDINTAPKDGTHILVIPHEDSREYVESWFNEIDKTINFGFWMTSIKRNKVMLSFYPYKWMPLPTPPKSGE